MRDKQPRQLRTEARWASAGPPLWQKSTKRSATSHLQADTVKQEISFHYLKCCLTHQKRHVSEMLSWWRDQSVSPFPCQRPWGSYYRTPSASLPKYKPLALLCLFLSFSYGVQSCFWSSCITSYAFCNIICPEISLTISRFVLPGHCAGAELGVMCSSMLSVRSRFLSLSSRPWYTIPVNWFASVWLLQRQKQKNTSHNKK